MKKSVPLCSQPLLILVHPGSLCGSFQTAHDWHPQWPHYAEIRRQQLCAEFIFLAAHKAVILGTDLDDEIVCYPAVQTAVAKAQRRYRAGTQDEALRRVVRQIWKDYAPRSRSIRVTGAWADPSDGCAGVVYRELRKVANVPVRLSPLAARHRLSADIIASGPVHPLGNSTSRAGWHVSLDAAALARNESRLQAWTCRELAWRELGRRLKWLGGTAVCAQLEEDLELILREGRTWMPLQREIVLLCGARSRCHQNVLHLWDQNRRLHVCTGYALSADGIWRSHSWGLDPANGWVIETTMKRVAYHGARLPRDEIMKRLSECW